MIALSQRFLHLERYDRYFSFWHVRHIDDIHFCQRAIGGASTGVSMIPRFLSFSFLMLFI